MSKQPVHQIGFDFLPRLPIVVEPKEVDVSSDAGILPLRQFDDQIGFTARFIDCLGDPRDPDQIEHTFPEMVRQRLFDCAHSSLIRRPYGPRTNTILTTGEFRLMIPRYPWKYWPTKNAVATRIAVAGKTRWAAARSTHGEPC